MGHGQALIKNSLNSFTPLISTPALTHLNQFLTYFPMRL